MIKLTVVLILLALGYGFGRRAEADHYKSLAQDEAKFRKLVVLTERRVPAEVAAVDSLLVGGNVVVSIDYFKRFLAIIRGFLGGRVTSYETLLERARREAIVRMKKQAWRKGASHIINVKLETASITKGQREEIGAVEVYAYGTALIVAK